MKRCHDYYTSTYAKSKLKGNGKKIIHMALVQKGEKENCIYIVAKRTQKETGDSMKNFEEPTLELNTNGLKFAILQ